MFCVFLSSSPLLFVSGCAKIGGLAPLSNRESASQMRASLEKFINEYSMNIGQYWVWVWVCLCAHARACVRAYVCVHVSTRVNEQA